MKRDTSPSSATEKLLLMCERFCNSHDHNRLQNLSAVVSYMLKQVLIGGLRAKEVILDCVMYPKTI